MFYLYHDHYYYGTFLTFRIELAPCHHWRRRLEMIPRQSPTSRSLIAGNYPYSGSLYPCRAHLPSSRRNYSRFAEGVLERDGVTYHTLPYLTIPHHTPHHTSPYPSPYLTIPHHTPHHTLPYLTIPIPYHTMPYNTIPYPGTRAIVEPLSTVS
jgi:hypothetical protein